MEKSPLLTLGALKNVESNVLKKPGGFDVVMHAVAKAIDDNGNAEITEEPVRILGSKTAVDFQ